MRNLLKILSVTVLVGVLFSCNDVLNNAQPSTSTTPEQAISTPSGVEAVRTGMYDRLHGFNFATEYFLAPEALADNLTSRTGANRFQAQTLNNPGAHAGAWFEGDAVLANGDAYDLIADANLLINGIPEGVLSEAALAQYRGEALFMRAFAYHHLVRAFGYEPGMTPSTGDGAGFDLGVILRLTPTLVPSDANYRPRATVDQVYDQIREDLDQAINLLGSNGTGNNIYANQAAAQALRARVELYARNYEEADEYATAALQNTSASLVEPEDVASIFDETSGINPEAIFVITTDPNTESLGVNDSPAAYTSQQWVSLVPPQDLMDLYDSDDARLGWYGPCIDDLVPEPVDGCFATHPSIADGEETLEISKWAAEQNQFADDYPFFRVPEMLLIQAEARLNTGGDAATPLNTLRNSRGLEDESDVDIEAILDERRREFAAEGQRFWDLKRLGRTIRKPPARAAQNVSINDVPYSDYVVLDNVPFREVALSQDNAPADSVLIQNPGY